MMSSCGYTQEKSQVGSGDIEFLYSMVRYHKPRRIVEIGAGGSTRITAAALERNFSETQEKAKLISIDPYAEYFLKSFRDSVDTFMEFNLIEKPIQFVDLAIFKSLKENDILFVDSSHVFKQGSDVEFEFLNVYPILKKGVIVHLHDIFVPFDYPLEWNMKEYLFLNEQYFLEVFLQFNIKFKVLASLSMVAHHENRVFLETLKDYHKGRKPGSFWMRAAL